MILKFETLYATLFRLCRFGECQRRPPDSFVVAPVVRRRSAAKLRRPSKSSSPSSLALTAHIRVGFLFPRLCLCKHGLLNHGAKSHDYIVQVQNLYWWVLENIITLERCLKKMPISLRMRNSAETLKRIQSQGFVPPPFHAFAAPRLPSTFREAKAICWKERSSNSHGIFSARGEENAYSPKTRGELIPFLQVCSWEIWQLVEHLKDFRQLGQQAPLRCVKRRKYQYQYTPWYPQYQYLFNLFPFPDLFQTKITYITLRSPRGWARGFHFKWPWSQILENDPWPTSQPSSTTDAQTVLHVAGDLRHRISWICDIKQPRKLKTIVYLHIGRN